VVLIIRFSELLNRHEGFTLQLRGETHMLTAHPKVLQRDRPGDYRLHGANRQQRPGT
jgi:hypothetical protein